MARLADPARAAARARGDTRYVSALPCKHGHIGLRAVISTACCTCADISRAKNRTKNSTGGKVGRPRKSPVAVRVVEHATRVKEAKSRFNLQRPKFANALADYHHTIEARERSKYLDSLLKRSPS